MAVPKKRISRSKKRIRKNIWKRKGYWTALKDFSLGNLFLQVGPKVFLCSKQKQISNKKFEES